jgi:hypothetical protein
VEACELKKYIHRKDAKVAKEYKEGGQKNQVLFAVLCALCGFAVRTAFLGIS